MQKKDYPKLRRCPFCNGEATTYIAYDDGYYVCCGECGCGLPVYNTEAEAIEAWNKRVPPTSEQIVDYIEKTMAENREMLGKLKKKHGFE